MNEPVVVKVGGSLFDLPNLGVKLRTWIDALPTRRVLIVAGGGPAAEMVRKTDDCDRLGEERSHWLALKALRFTAHLLTARLPESIVIEEISQCNQAWRKNKLPVLDMNAFCLADESRADHPPHLWQVTSDSLSARVAIVAGITKLVLLKSRDPVPNQDWESAARLGVVDQEFAKIVASANLPLEVSVVNFRALSVVASSVELPPDRGL